MRILTAVLGIFTICAVAHAQDVRAPTVTCEKGNLRRVVEITYAGEIGQPPCEVHYQKVVEQPGHDAILWNAEHTAGYCKEKMDAFVDKLRGMGWSCS